MPSVFSLQRRAIRDGFNLFAASIDRGIGRLEDVSNQANDLITSGRAEITAGFDAGLGSLEQQFGIARGDILRGTAEARDALAPRFQGARQSLLSGSTASQDLLRRGFSGAAGEIRAGTADARGRIDESFDTAIQRILTDFSGARGAVQQGSQGALDALGGLSEARGLFNRAPPELLDRIDSAQFRAPFESQIAAGRRATSQLSGLLGLRGGDPSAALDFLEASPAFQFRINQATQAIERSAAAQGLGVSGNALDAINKQVQALASDEFGARADRLANLAGLGVQAGGVLGQLESTQRAQDISQRGQDVEQQLSTFLAQLQQDNQQRQLIQNEAFARSDIAQQSGLAQADLFRDQGSLVASLLSQGGQLGAQLSSDQASILAQLEQQFGTQSAAQQSDISQLLANLAVQEGQAFSNLGTTQAGALAQLASSLGQGSADLQSQRGIATAGLNQGLASLLSNIEVQGIIPLIQSRGLANAEALLQQGNITLAEKAPQLAREGVALTK